MPGFKRRVVVIRLLCEEVHELGHLSVKEPASRQLQVLLQLPDGDRQPLSSSPLIELKAHRLNRTSSVTQSVREWPRVACPGEERTSSFSEAYIVINELLELPL